MDMTITFLGDKYIVDAYEAVLDEGKTAIMIPHRELLKVLTQMQAENDVLVSEEVKLIYSENNRYSFLYKLICEKNGKRMEATSVGEADAMSDLSKIGKEFIICTAYARAVDKAILQMLKILTDNDGKKVVSDEDILSDTVKGAKTEVIVKNIKDSVQEMAVSSTETKNEVSSEATPAERTVINKANTMANQVKNTMKNVQKKEKTAESEIKEEKPVVTEYKQSAAQADESPVIDDETSVITDSELEDDVVDAVPEDNTSKETDKTDDSEINNETETVEEAKVETIQDTKKSINDLNKAEKEELNALFKEHKDIIFKIVNDEITVDEAIMETNISAEKIDMLVKGVEQMQAKAGKVSPSKNNADVIALGEYVVTKGHSKGKKLKDADKADIEWLAKKDIGEMGNKAKSFLACTAQ